MAKNDVVVVPKTKKQKFLNVLKVVGICFGAMIGFLACVVLYVYLFVGFLPVPVPLSQMSFSQEEYVIDDVSSIKIVPNEGCTELDGIKIKIMDTNIVTLIEDETTKPLIDEEEGSEGVEPATEPTDVIYEYFLTSANADIQIKPLTKTINAGTPEQKEINVGGWVKLVAEKDLVTTSCWVFVDVAVESFDMSLETPLDQTTIENQVYNIVYPNTEIQLSTGNYSPLASTNVPKTTLSTGTDGKTTTNFNNTKNIYYVVSDETLATVDNQTGKLKIAENAEGEFTVFAYTIANYLNIGKEPVLEDYIAEFGQAGYDNWKLDFDKIRVCTQEVHFHVKEVEVEGITVAKDKLNFDLLSKNNQVQINFISTSTNKIDTEHPTVYHYAVDLQMSHDSASKGTLFENVILAAGYIDNSSTNPNKFYSDDGKWIVVDDTYLQIFEPTIDHSTSPTKVAWNVVVNQYRASGNVLVFAYPIFDAEGNITNYHTDYVEIGINKVAIEDLTFSNVSNEIAIEWNDTLAYAEPIDLNNTVSVYPANATYNNKQLIKYFAKADSSVIELDSTLKIKIGNDDYYAICSNDGSNIEHNIIKPLGPGNVTVVAAVLVYDANGKMIVGDDGYAKFDYAGILGDSISVNIEKKVSVVSVDVTDTHDQSILTSNTVTIAKGDTIKLLITCDENVVDGSLFKWAIDGDSNQDMLSVIGTVSIQNSNTLVYTLSANKEGTFDVYIANAQGNRVANIESITFDVQNTDLRALNLSTNGSYGVGIELTEDSYNWVVKDEYGALTAEQLSFAVSHEPANTNNKDFDVYAYEVASDFSADDLANLDVSTLNASDILTFGTILPDQIDSIVPQITKSGKAVVCAMTKDGNIISNLILIDITLPNIVVEFSYGNQQNIVSVDGQSKNLFSYDTQDEQDGRQGDKFRIGFYQLTSDMSVVAGKEYYLFDGTQYVVQQTPTINNLANYYEFINIGSQIKFRFAGEFTQEDDLLTSTTSGATISNVDKTLKTVNINTNTQEVVVMYTDFGFVSSAAQCFVYNLIPDFKVETTSYNYYTPGYADIFVDGFEQVAIATDSQIATYFEFDGTNYQPTTDTIVDGAKTYYVHRAPGVKFTNYAGDVLYLPRNYDTSKLTDYYKGLFVDIKTVLSVSPNNSTLCTSQNGGLIKLFGIPETDTTVTINVAVSDGVDLGYTKQYLFTIVPSVTTQFASNKDQDVYVVDDIETTDDGNGNYSFVTGNVLDLSDKITHQTTNGASVTIQSIKFSSNFVEIKNVDAFEGNKIALYKSTTDTEIDANKKYYVSTANGYQKVLAPLAEELSTYFEVADIYAEYDSANQTITLSDSLLTNALEEFAIKLQITAKVVKDGVSATMNSYYTIIFQF